MLVSRRVRGPYCPGKHVGVGLANAGESIEGPQYGLDRAEHIAFGMGERVQAEAPQCGAQSRCIRLAHFEIMDEVTCALEKFGVYAGKVIRISRLERDGSVADVLQQIPDLPEIGIFVHARLIIRGEHRWHKY